MLLYRLSLECPQSSLVLWLGVSKLDSKVHMLKVKILSHVLFSETKSIRQEKHRNIKLSLIIHRNSSRFESKISNTVKFFT
jgi:hypothetical protein